MTPSILLPDWVFSDSGLYSSPAEAHATILALVVVLVVVALDRRGHPVAATLLFAVGILVALFLPASGIEYKSWYFGGPLAVLAGGYLIYDRRDRVKQALLSRGKL